MIRAMIDDLPEGSRFTAAMSALSDGKSPDHDPDPAEVKRADARVWSLDRRLLALNINATHRLINVTGRAAGMWPANGGPQHPVIGPSDWSEKTKNNEAKKNVTVMDVLRSRGWSG